MAQKQADGLYDSGVPYDSGYMDTADGEHKIYYEQYGNPNGVPIVLLHGGPGAGFGPYFPRMCDPDHFRIVVYDQRGAPKSIPSAKIEANSPDLLVEDNEQLRKKLGIDKWHVYGGSWGSTLALLYAEKYPERVESLTLRGVFTMREQELDAYINKMNTFFPERRKEFIGHIPPAERGDLLTAYYNRLVNPDPAVHLEAARIFVRNENGCAHRIPLSESENNDPGDKVLPFARIEAHFMHNYMPDDRIIKNLHRIAHIPTMIVQGRYDVVCPKDTAIEVHENLPYSALELTDAGHSATEPETLRGLVASFDRIRDYGMPIMPPPGPLAAPVIKPPA